MALERLTQITEVGIQSGITLRNVNVEGAYVSGVVTATSLNVTSSGANFTGVVTATTFVGNVTGNINPSSLVVTGVSTFQASSHWGDGDVAYFGTDDDLLIFHNSTDSIIRDTGTGDLYIEGGNVIRMTNPTGIETYATFNQDASVELYYDGNKKFETTGVGVTAYGSISVGRNFIGNNAVGLGSTTTTGRNAGVGTATGTLIYNATTDQLEAYGPEGWINVKKLIADTGLTATGGVISEYTDPGPGNIYRAHIFASTGTFEVTSLANGLPDTVDYLLVGGGGGGGNDNGGGGGGGTVHYRTDQPVSVQSYTVTIGAGAAGEGRVETHITPAGNSSSIPGFSITAPGGGTGGNGNNPGSWNTGRSGGSGGGGATNSGSGGTGNGDPSPGGAPFVSPSNGWGNDGGTGSSPVGLGGGGGGAGGAGKSHNDGTYRAGGGSGLTIPAVSMSGYEIKVAGGGGGGGPAPGGTSGGAAQDNPAAVDAGGASVKSAGPGNPGNNARSSSGGGGGGAGAQQSQGGNGGSGIAVIRYQIGTTQKGGTAKATGGAISFSGGKTIHQFVSSGTFTVTNPSLTSADILVVGAGGGGASRHGGGGGAGALIYRTGETVNPSPGVYTITVGSGGGGLVGAATGNAVKGNNTTAFGFTAEGGGYGTSTSTTTPGGPGGSGGGSRGNNNPPSVGGTASGAPGGTNGAVSPPSGWGNPGGTGDPTPGYGGGGGGGAGAVGSNGSPTVGGAGGNGLSYNISGITTFYAGGGGGAYQPGSPVNWGGAGGTGGGGQGGGDVIPAMHGRQGTGGGGGAGGSADIAPNPLYPLYNPVSGVPGGNGGSGIVIIAYPS